MNKKELENLKSRAKLNNIQERSGVTVCKLKNKKWKCWSCGKERVADFPIDEQGNKYCPDCNTNQ